MDGIGRRYVSNGLGNREIGMATRKETKHDKELKKVLGMNEGLTVRDYVGFVFASDYPRADLKRFQDYFDVGVGDFVYFISFHWKSPKHKAKASAATRKLSEKHGFITKKLPKGLGRK